MAYSSTASHVPSLRRGILPFAPTLSLELSYADAAGMDEIITSGSVATASHPEFDTQDETMDTTGNIDDELDDIEEGEGEDEAMEVEPELVPQKKEMKIKRATDSKPAEPRVKWTSKEDECLAEAWKTISIDPITGTNQNNDTYWGIMKTTFDERKLVDPDFASIHMDHGEKAMANSWSTIQTTYNKWHDIIEEGSNRLKEWPQACLPQAHPLAAATGLVGTPCIASR
ncbi:D-2-hydroxyglutarate dehydrogenase, mitochondrial [Hordeum vulgare]|nr:D-2-hydroxyglutarate dehydrogenase, mitochondrial [Hordeum vulgare]